MAAFAVYHFPKHCDSLIDVVNLNNVLHVFSFVVVCFSHIYIIVYPCDTLGQYLEHSQKIIEIVVNRVIVSTYDDFGCQKRSKSLLLQYLGPLLSSETVKPVRNK